MKFFRARKDLVNEKLGEHYNMNRQGHGAILTKAQMYEARYRAEFEGWKARKIEAYFGVSYRYAVINIMGYRTMAGVCPVKGVKPEDYCP